MSYLQVQPAVEALHQLERPTTKDAVLSFAEATSIRTAAWAVHKFAGALLIDRVRHEYYANPMRDESGNAIPIERLQGDEGDDMEGAQLDGAHLADEITADLKSGLNRINRGYPLETVTVRGVQDTSTIIASLERAVEVNPENLDNSDQYFQAAAQYMLEHMVSQDDGTQQTYLL